MIRIIIISVAFIIITGHLVLAQTDTIYASYTYTMGDNDTKSDAKQLCFLYAKRQCLEKAGTFVQSELKVSKKEQTGKIVSDYSEITQQDISTYSGAFIKVDIVSEQFAYAGEIMTITIQVKAIIDIDVIFDQIIAIRNDRNLQQEIKDQQQQIAQMEASIREMQNKLNTNNIEEITKTRSERLETFVKLNEFERIKNVIIHKTRLAIENIELGMTINEVIDLIGKPRAQSSAGNVIGYNYGNAWIVFQHGIVNCIVKCDHYSYVSVREYYEVCHPEDIIK